MLRIYTLTDARRHLRRIQVSTEKLTKLLGLQSKSENVNETKSSLGTLSEYLQTSQKDLDELQAISVALATTLFDEENNYMARLQRQTDELKSTILAHIATVEKRLEQLTTQYDSKLQVLLRDLERRFKDRYNTRFLVRQAQDRDIGVLSLNKINTRRFAFCVILAEPLSLEDNAAIKNVGRNQYKMFFNTIPSDIALENFHPFLSPSRVTQDILKTLHEEGF